MMNETNVHGPIDFLLLEFTGGHDLSTTASALIDLIERGIVNLYDLVAIQKADDGTFSLLELDGLGDEIVFISGARSGLLGDDDMQAAAETMLPGTTGVLLMYENTWAVPFVTAGENGAHRLREGRWWLVPWWAKEMPKAAMFNARSESAGTSGAFKDAFASTRCLIPADGFYE